MASNPDDLRSSFPANLTLAEMVSSVPPVPQAVVTRVARIPYPRSIGSDWASKQKNIPQIITALVLLEQSPAGIAWGVQLDAIPNGTMPTNNKYKDCLRGNSTPLAMGCVEWFYKRSKVCDTAPMASVAWKTPGPSQQYDAIGFACEDISRMLYAAQNFQPSPNITNVNVNVDVSRRLEAMEDKIAALQSHITALSIRREAPTVTCLMYLFAVDTGILTLSSPCNLSSAPDQLAQHPSTLNTRLPSNNSGGASGGSASTTGDGGGGTDDTVLCPRETYFSIAPHTDRLSNLSFEAINWLLHQLDTRKVWVRATDLESEDNHISWAPFPGAVEIGKHVVLTHGNHRFW